ncbi:MAG: hypothetical protein ABSA54_12625 [Terriglobales bacterium]|jgi:hypothetical protein
MKYVKPDVVPLASAIDAVQSSTEKKHHVTLDSESILATTNAYEADE